ncbi:MAG: cysteine--tRNA ligase, partial [Sulfurimonas sp.]|nr:cysteine--tRNA ligase [Sulfurimonas sp.]
MFIYDSVTKEKRKFIPLQEGKATLYVCGPTVYDDAHLGHAKSALVFDLLTRVLSANGLDVTYARNITDIDDKIIKKAVAQDKDIKEITDYYTDSFHKEMEAIGVKRPDIEPKATESLEAMFDMIQKLIDTNHAYTTKDGDVYFDTESDAKYLTLSGRVQNEDEKQERVVSSELKKNPADFAMWKSVKDGSLTYDSPFGAGRPGWHLECSAMIEKHLARPDTAFSIDIHGGGADLLFPHHENEAAQTRCSSNHELANYWMHNGFVNINGEKMSKSLGNSFFLKDALKEYDGEVLRFYLLSTHYRSNFNFNTEDLSIAKKRLDKIYRLKKRLFGLP